MATTSAPPTLDPKDVLGLDHLLGDEDIMLRDSVRRWVGDRILPEIGSWFEEGILPRELAKEVGDLGLLGMHLEGYGCAGASATAYGVACRELEYGDSGIRSLVSVQGSLAMFPIWKFGSEEQKRQWLPGMAAGDLIGCFGLTEPDFGSEPSGMRTKARRDGDDWVINGSKQWITNGGIADVAVVWARHEEERSDDERAARGTIRGFVVPTDTKGFSVSNIHHKLSLRASVSSELSLDDVRLPADAVLPGVKSMRGPLSCLNEARYGICWGAVGAGRACYESALEYSKTRVQYGRPIAGFQLTQRKLVDMMLELQKAQLVAWRLGQLKDAGELDPRQVSVGKLNNVREALAVAREARTILGASGITTEYPIMRHANNLESVLTYEGTSEIHTLILGEALTGERALT
jgi:glutaryl-CoA dehydrogenase